MEIIWEFMGLCRVYKGGSRFKGLGWLLPPPVTVYMRV